MMVELFCGVLSGGAVSTELGGLRIKDRPFRVSQFFLAIDASRSMPLEEFKRRASEFTQSVRETTPAPGYEDVMVAGDPERRYVAGRVVDGVPVGAGLWDQLKTIAGRYGVGLPEPI
jgi:LDH2 family malate/lactate/ureidoglycolate dehydrogenase